MGISWGAKLVVAVAAQYPELCDGLCLVGPGIYAYQQTGPAGQAFLWLLRTLGLGKLKVAIPLQDPRLFTENPAWLDYLATDPLTLRRITVYFATEDLKLNRVSAKKSSGYSAAGAFDAGRA